MSEEITTIIAAIIGALGAIIASNFKDIVSIFRRADRRIAGHWKGKSHRIIYDPQTLEGFRLEPADEYVLNIKQLGTRVTALMTETKVPRGLKPSIFKWKGRLYNDYYVYKCFCEDAKAFMISSAILHIHAGGNKMTGYFVANSGATGPLRTWIGFAEIERTS